MKLSRIAKAVAIATFGVLAITPGVGQAASIVPFLTNPANPSPPPPNLNTFQDTDVERILRPNDEGGFDVVTTGNLQVGDIIETAALFDTVNGATIPVLVGSLTYQLMAYSRISVVSLFDPNTNNACAATVCDIVFGAGFADGVTAAQVFERDPGLLPAAPFSGTPASAIAAITGGTLVFAAGFGQADDFWTSADARIDLGAFAGLPIGGQVGVGNFGLSQLAGGLINVVDNLIPANNAVTGVTTTHAFGGNTSVFALEPNTDAGWLVSSNTTVKFTTVPEPGTMALLGLALLGAGVATRRGARQRQDGLV